ncbi:MAG: hypothetical protein ACEPOW_09335 [Bacteroidales bacterium]
MKKSLFFLSLLFVIGIFYSCKKDKQIETCHVNKTSFLSNAKSSPLEVSVSSVIENEKHEGILLDINETTNEYLVQRVLSSNGDVISRKDTVFSLGSNMFSIKKTPNEAVLFEGLGYCFELDQVQFSMDNENVAVRLKSFQRHDVSNLNIPLNLTSVGGAFKTILGAIEKGDILIDPKNPSGSGPDDEEIRPIIGVVVVVIILLILILIPKDASFADAVFTSSVDNVNITPLVSQDFIISERLFFHEKIVA